MDAIPQLQQIVASNAVVLFMRGTPEKPMCLGSYQAVRALQESGADFTWIDVQTQPLFRAYLPKFSDYPSVPQLYMQGELIGGEEIIRELQSQGELAEMAQNSQPLHAQAS